MWRGLLVAAFLVATAVPAVSNAAPVMAQEDACDPESSHETWWIDVCRPTQLEGAFLSGPLSNVETLQGWEVQFVAEGAKTNPELATSELMVVRVRKGEFVLDLAAAEAIAAQTVDTSEEFDPENPEVLISSLDPVMEYTREFSEDSSEYGYHSSLGAIYQPAVGDCTVSCPVDPNIPIRLNAGDVAMVKVGTTCLWCLLNAQNAEVPDAPDFETGILDVFVVSNDQSSFSWLRDWEGQARLMPDPIVATSLDGAPVAQTRFAWAFNPGSTRCGGGH
jgi:hypothetical protein